MFFVMFFIVLGCGCVPKMGAASLVGFIAGVLSTLMSMICGCLGSATVRAVVRWLKTNKLIA
jgi:hypothetical protein